jgi:hypothetical protein
VPPETPVSGVATLLAARGISVELLAFGASELAGRGCFWPEFKLRQQRR